MPRATKHAARVRHDVGCRRWEPSSLAGLALPSWKQRCDKSWLLPEHWVQEYHTLH